MARTLDKKYSNLSEMKAAGFTDEDIRDIINGPRSTEATWADDYSTWTWPKVNGFTVCGTSLLNKTEKDAYNKYKKHLEEARGVVSAKGTSATKDMWQSCYETVMATGNQSLASQFMKLMPSNMLPATSRLLLELFGVPDVGMVKKCTVHWLMFRSPSGEYAEKRMLTAEDLGPLFIQGWTPVFTLSEIRTKLDKLKELGVDLSKTVRM